MTEENAPMKDKPVDAEAEHLEKLIQEVQEPASSRRNRSKDKSNDLIGDAKRKKKKKIALIILGVVVLIAAIVIPLVLLLGSLGHGADYKKQDDAALDGSTQTSRIAAKKLKVGVDKEFIPFHYEDWQRGVAPKNGGDPEKAIKDGIMKKYAPTRLAPSAFPNSKDFPSDFDSKYVKGKNGEETQNPNWVYWNDAVFTEQAGRIVENLVNPVLGGWGAYQTTDGTAATNPFSRYSSPEFDSKVLQMPLKDWAPMFFDNSDNPFGMLSKEDVQKRGGIAYFGQVKDMSTELIYSRELGGYNYAKVHVVAEYGIKLPNKKIATTEGRFTVTLYPAWWDEFGNSRVFIQDITKESDFTNNRSFVLK